MSHKRHIVESIVNVGSGAIIAYSISVTYFHFVPNPNTMDALILTVILTLVSVLRGYIWRHYFHNRWSDEDK